MHSPAVFQRRDSNEEFSAERLLESPRPLC